MPPTAVVRINEAIQRLPNSRPFCDISAPHSPRTQWPSPHQALSDVSPLPHTHAPSHQLPQHRQLTGRSVLLSWVYAVGKD